MHKPNLKRPTQILALFALAVVLVGIGIQMNDVKKKKTEDLVQTFEFVNPDIAWLNNQNEVLPLDNINQNVKVDDTLRVEEEEPAWQKGDITAEAYLVGNLDTGEIYLSKNTERIYGIASISKLFTAMTARDVFDEETKITITEDMLVPYGATVGIEKDAVFSALELEYPLVIESSNDVAEAFAIYHGYDKFIEQMNAYAKEIGLESTSFKDSSGLSSGNVSSAVDLFNFARFLYKDAKDILELSVTPTYTMPESDGHKELQFKNTNVFVGDPSFRGGKTGRTDFARETMLSLFEYDIDNEKYPIAIVVLKADFGMRQMDTAVLIEKFYDTVK